MSLTPAILDAMVAAGASQDVILAAVKADMLERGMAEEQRLVAKREGARIRQQRKRGKSRDVTPVTRDECDPSPNDIYSNPQPNPSVVSNETTPPADLILVSEAAEPDQLKPEHVVEAWNEVAERRGLAKVKQLTPQRRRKLVSRIKEAGVDGFTEAIGTIEASPFLRGENGRGWRADFDWMLEPKNFTKLREGTYGH